MDADILLVDAVRWYLSVHPCHFKSLVTLILARFCNQSWQLISLVLAAALDIGIKQLFKKCYAV